MMLLVRNGISPNQVPIFRQKRSKNVSCCGSCTVNPHMRFEISAELISILPNIRRSRKVRHF